MTTTIRNFSLFLGKLRLPVFILIASLLCLSIVSTSHAAVYLSDNFDDGVTDTTKWRFGVLSRNSTHFDPQIQVVEQSGRLTIFPPMNLAGTHYNGYISTQGSNFTDAFAAIEVIGRDYSSAQTIFGIGLDKNNFFRFRIKGNTLYLESAGNPAANTSIRFDAIQHHFLKFRHILATDSIVYETSPDAVNWFVVKSVPRSFPITNLLVELNAGTSEAVSPVGVTQFDNFMVATNTATPSPSPSPTPLPSPSPSPTPFPSPSPTPSSSASQSRGYLTTPAELAQIKIKSQQGIEPYRSAVNALLTKAGTPSSWSFGVVDPNNRDLLQDAAAMVYAKSMAYHLTGNAEFAAVVRQKILEMSVTNTCANDYSGSNGCILTLSRHVPGYIAAADLIADYPGWTAGDKQTFQIWLRDKVYRFTDWASDARSTNWGSVGTAATLYIADYFANSSFPLIDRSGVVFSAHQAFLEARQRAYDRNNGNSYMYNSVCPQTIGLGFQNYGGIPEETGRGSTGCWGNYLLTNDDSWSYMIAHLSGTLPTAELLLRRGDRGLYDNLRSDGKGSILRAILYVIENPVSPANSFNWLDSRKSILEIAYRYYRHPAIARQLGIGTSSRHIAGSGNSAMPHFGTLTHGFAIGENPPLPPIIPAP